MSAEQPSTRPYTLSPSQAALKPFLIQGVATVISKGCSLCKLNLSYQAQPKRLEELRTSKCDPQDQDVKDLAIVLLTPGVATNLTEVRVLLSHAKKIISELEGNFEESLRAIAKFEELSSEE